LLKVVVEAMRKSYYDADSIDCLLRWFEDEYGMSSDAFYDAHLANGALPGALSRFERHTWASFYREAKRMNGRSFAERAERALATV